MVWVSIHPAGLIQLVPAIYFTGERLVVVTVSIYQVVVIYNAHVMVHSITQPRENDKSFCPDEGQKWQNSAPSNPEVRDNKQKMEYPSSHWMVCFYVYFSFICSWNCLRNFQLQMNEKYLYLWKVDVSLIEYIGHLDISRNPII